MSDATVVLKLRTDEAKAATKLAIFRAVQETFELDIKPQAQRDTPVKTGTNRRSIDTEVEQVADGVKAELFTQSGYGAYLELGTRKMDARPYLWPAFEQFVGRIYTRTKELLHG
jgi:HK97 gp10 family phage protein